MEDSVSLRQLQTKLPFTYLAINEQRNYKVIFSYRFCVECISITLVPSIDFL